jgi:hypothetical protein
MVLETNRQEVEKRLSSSARVKRERLTLHAA